MRGVPRERRGHEARGVGGEADLEDLGRATKDVLELGIGVVVEPVRHAEAVAERAGDAPHPRRGADDGEVLDLEPHGARARSLAEHDVERVVLHGRVEDLLDRVAEPMDLVDEQDVALAEAGEDGRQVAGALDGRSGGRADLGAHLRGHDVGERGLAESGRTVEQDVVDRLGPMLGGVDEDREVLLHAILAGELVEPAGPDGRLEGELLLGDVGGGDALDRHRCGAATLDESNM